ncbi:MAG TPA: YbhB/YbcL family Raf kinase inhibitor-like protein [Candidatus Sulfotelmatobacter sp.]|nr:YbhB/YbcL family Raf kinase inhibitor-like protein [Candidatus Sulfotelmatobacter sp.]
METKTKLAVTSTSFKDGQTIPDTAVFDGFGCTGGNRSPQLSWSGAPAGTKSFAITIWDPDAPTGVGFVHWVLFDIPATTTSLPEGAGAKSDAGVGGIHGTTDFGTQAYGGPCPPPGHGPHHYHITVYALDVPQLGLDKTTSYAKFKFVSNAHVLASGELVGIYERT